MSKYQDEIAQKATELLQPVGDERKVVECRAIWYSHTNHGKLINYTLQGYGNIDTLVASVMEVERNIKSFAHSGEGIYITGGDGTELINAMSLELFGDLRAIRAIAG